MATSATDEHELIAAVRRGDQEAFGRLVEAYRSRLHGPAPC